MLSQGLSRRLVLTVVATLAALLLVGAFAARAARASTTQESTFQDDDLLKGSTTQQQTLAVLQSLGVNRVRVTVVWADIAPKDPVLFNPTDPNSPGYDWRIYDSLVRNAAARGIAVNFTVSTPAPSWAVPAGHGGSYEPDPTKFGQFVEALGKRYSGSWPVGGIDAIPRVSYWSLMNEPNEGTRIAPQRASNGAPIAPAIYRGLLDKGYAALVLTGHRTDTMVIGDLAAKGGTQNVPPMEFVRALYCVDTNLNPVPSCLRNADGGDSSAAGFAPRHPAMFRSTGVGLHPYSYFAPPDAPAQNRDDVLLADSDRLYNLVGGIFRRYPNGDRSALGLYMTEFGYNTNPPDGGVPYNPTQAAGFINEAEYIAWRNPRIHTMSQFLLRDYPPDSHLFHSGLIFRSGQLKPGFFAYRLPFYIPDTTVGRGQSFEVWCDLRSAPRGTGQIQFLPSGSSTWRIVRTFTTGNPRGYYDTRLPLGTGSVRIHLAGTSTYSRTVGVRAG